MGGSEIINDASAERILEHLQRLCGLGSRAAGSVADREAGAYCMERFKEFGLETKTESFEIADFEERAGEVRVVKPQRKDLTSRAILRSISTPPEGITSEVVHIGAGRREDYEGLDVAGKIVLLDSIRISKPHIVSLIDIAKDKGAIGFIQSSFTPGYVVDGMGAHRFGTPIPAVSIAAEDSSYIREKLRYGPVKVWIRLETRLVRGSAINVIGIMKGKELPEEFIYVTGHSDTLHTGVGANDNASGMAGVLEVARVLSNRAPKRSLAFIIFSGEEGGCHGSAEYVDRHKNELKNIKAVLNLDMVGVGNELSIMGEANWFKHGREPAVHYEPPKWFQDYIFKTASDLGYIMGAEGDGICGDDGPFAGNGVPATFWNTVPDPYYHSELDTIKNCNVNMIKLVSDIVATTALRLANEEKIPL